MLLDVAANFIAGGETLAARHNCLKIACTAWNYASAPAGTRAKLLDKWVTDYRKWNPDADDEECRSLRKDRDLIVRQKIAKYPRVRRQIISCDLKVVDGQDHVFVTTVSQELPPNFRLPGSE